MFRISGVAVSLRFFRLLMDSLKLTAINIYGTVNKTFETDTIPLYQVSKELNSIPAREVATSGSNRKYTKFSNK